MSRKLLTNFNAAPYYDDFDLDKNFLKVLFKPGVALQTRELNQLQSIINDQNSKFANHIFKDGSSVFDGNITVDVNVKYIKLHDYERNIPDTTGVNVNSYLTELENRTLVSEDGTVEFLVKRVEVSNTNEPNTVVGLGVTTIVSNPISESFKPALISNILALASRIILLSSIGP